MKNKMNLLTILFTTLIFTSCKKEAIIPIEPVNTQNQTLTVNQLLVGKWLVIKDSVETLDAQTPIQNVGPNFYFNPNNFIVFNIDSTANISNSLTLDALFPNYKAYNSDSQLFYTPSVLPNLSFKFKVDSELTIPAVGIESKSKTTYALNMLDANSLIGYGFQIVNFSTTHLQLYRREEHPTILHYYVLNEYIYLEKLNIVDGF